MSTETDSENVLQRKHSDDRRDSILLALLVLLLSFICVFCSAQTALSLINRTQIPASIAAGSEADYGPDPRIVFPKINPDAIIATITSEPSLVGGTIEAEDSLAPVPLPVLPTPTPPTPPSPTLIALAPPTLTPSPTPVPSSPVPEPVTPTALPTALPTVSPPTSVPTPLPTPEPTLPLPPTVVASPTTAPTVVASPTTAPTVAASPTTVPTVVASPTTLASPTSIATATDVPTPTSEPPTPEPTPEPPKVFFNLANYTVTESDGVATITIMLDKVITDDITVIFSTSDGSALGGVDYSSVSTIVTILGTTLFTTVDIPILPDTLDENDETVNLTLSGVSSNAELGTPSSAILTILDDDDPPTVQFGTALQQTSEDVGTTPITLTLSTASTFNVAVDYNTQDDTALSSDDYISTTNTANFSPGQTVVTFTVTVTDDNIYELDEQLTLNLSSPINASLGTPATATLIITNDDAFPVVQYDAANYDVLESSGPAVITTTLTPASALTVSVDYDSADLSATAGADYITSTGVLTFTPGQTVLTYTITTLDDTLIEGEETALLTLKNPVNALLGLITATLTITSDGSDSDGCNGIDVPSEPNIGMPDGVFAEVGCGSAIIVDLMGTPIDSTSVDADFDFVYYERGQPNPPTTTTQIFLDWTIVEIAPDITGPWYQVFYWGDAITDTNTNIGQSGFGPATNPPDTEENDNELIFTTFLSGTFPYTTGIAIDVDPFAPPDLYRFIRFSSPSGGADDPTQVDAVEILP